MAKTIKILRANLRSWSGTFTPSAITTVHISAPFDQLLAEGLGVKDRIYKRKGSDEDPDFNEYGLDIDWIGAGMTVRAIQGSLFEKSIDDNGIQFTALQMCDFKIKRHKDDEQQLISFNVKIQDDDATLHQLLHSVKKEAIDIDLKPPTKKSASEALADGRQAGLFPKPKDKKDRRKPDPDAVTVDVKAEPVEE